MNRSKTLPVVTANMKACVCLFLYVACIQGQKLYLKGSNSSAILGHSYKFICSIVGNGSLQGLLYINKHKTLTVCTVISEDCSPLGSNPGYSCGCLSGETGVFYAYITSVEKDDTDDNWVCQYGGMTSNSIKLDVLFAPTITSVPSNVTVTENTCPNINCSTNITSGNPSSTSYKWTGPGGYSNTGAVLDRNLTKSHGGLYTCTANNTETLYDTAHVYINILYAPTVTSLPANVSVRENTMFYRDCSMNLIPGYPLSTNYSWTGPGDYNLTGAVLNRTVTRTEGGRYACTATNAAGLYNVVVINVYIQYLDLPSMYVSPSQVSENDSVQLFCNVSSNPVGELTINNLDNNTLLVDQEVTNNQHYVIERAQCLHNGTFQCLAENKKINQTKESSQWLSVLCQPRHDFRQTMNSTLSKAINETATMIFDAIANPLPNFTWWKSVDDQLEPISVQTVHTIHNTDLKSTLRIKLIHVRDYGMYAVHVENEIDDYIQLFTLSQISSPSPPEDVTIVCSDSTTVTLMWISNYNGGSDQTFSIEYRTEQTEWSMRTGEEDPGRGKRLRAKLTGLLSNSKYIFRVFAQNMCGISEKVTVEETTLNNSVEIVGDQENDRFGIGLAIGFGTMLPVVILLLIVIIMFFRQGNIKSSRSDEKDPCSQNMHGRTYANIPNEGIQTGISEAEPTNNTTNYTQIDPQNMDLSIKQPTHTLDGITPAQDRCAVPSPVLPRHKNSSNKNAGIATNGEKRTSNPSSKAYASRESIINEYSPSGNMQKNNGKKTDSVTVTTSINEPQAVFSREK